MIENLIYLKIISPGTLLILKILVLFLSLFFLIAIFYLLQKTSWLKFRFLLNMTEFLTYRPYGVKKISKVWTKIMGRLETGSEAEYKLVVIEADNILNEVLERMGHKGETLGDRLKQLTTATLPNIEEVWEAHKIRNNIVHDPDYKLSLNQARKVMAIYEETLKNLGVF